MRATRLRSSYSLTLLLTMALVGASVVPGDSAPGSRASAAQTQDKASPPAQSQGSAAQSQSAKPLRSATRLVELSVIVKDRQGNPVPDLTSADFVIRDANQTQSLRFFRVETNVAPSNPPNPLPPDTYTNRPEDSGRVPASITMILFDGLNTALADQASAREHVIKFLKQIQPQDHIALYALGNELRMVHDFTTDSARLVEALNRSGLLNNGDLDAATAQPPAQTGNDNIDSLLQAASQHEANFYITDRVHLTVQALTEIAQHVSPLPGRKNLIWVSGSFPFSVGYDNVDDLLHNINNPTNEQLIFADDIERAARALNDANIAVYPVDARGLLGLDMRTNQASNRLPAQGPTGSAIGTANGNTGGLSGLGTTRGGPRTGRTGGGVRSRPPQPSADNTRNSSPIASPDKNTFDTMNTLAARTGGKAFYDTNDIFGSIRQAVEDSRLSYEIGYYPDIRWDGSFHEVSVEVKRPGLQVRTRKGYFALPDPKPTPDSRRDALRLAAMAPIDPAALPIGVHVKATDTPGTRVIALSIRFDPHAVEFQQRGGAWTANLDAVLVQRDADGKVLTGTDDALQLNLPDDKYQAALRNGFGYPKQVDVNENAAEVRVILRDAASGKLGAVSIPVAKYFPSAPKAP